MAVPSHACKFGWKAVPFMLLGTDGHIHSSERESGENGTVVMFICNHCPYVKAVIERIVEDAKALASVGVTCLAINSNDAENYPEDSFDNMVSFAKKWNFPFPYLLDASQEVAYAFGALCTPDFFGFNRRGELQYRGKLDDVGMKESSHGRKRLLVDAMTMVAQTQKGPLEQSPSMGCSIKWRADSAYVLHGYKMDPRSASA